MSKQLYEEALADVKKVKEVAEDSAKKAVLEAITPRIREFIESELLKEQDEEDEFSDEEVDMSSVDPLPADDELMFDSVDQELDPSASAMSLPDEEGKVTLDLDSLASDSDEEFVVSDEVNSSLSKLSDLDSLEKFESKLYRIGESVARLTSASKLIFESQGFKSKLFDIISNLEDMYSYVQESVSDLNKRSDYETKLENYYKEITKFQETKMRSKKMMTEEDVTLKLTGLPDDVDLESIGVDLITGDDMSDEGSDDESSDDVELDLDAGDEEGSSEEGESDDVELDLDSGDEDSEEEVDMEEALSLPDDAVVEIDESVLVKEIARAKRLRETAVPSTKGHAMTSSVLDDFGDGDDEGDALLDQDVTTSLNEMDEVMDEEDDADHEMKHEKTVESVTRRLQFEKRLQERARNRAAKIKAEAKSVKSRLEKQKLQEQYARNAKRFNESVKRSNKLRGILAEAKQSVIENRSNSVSNRLAEKKAVDKLREKLAETNLANAKLMYANKLLQSEHLTSKQKSQVIDQLDAAKTVNEAKLVYESVVKTVSSSRNLREGARQVLGSSSRATAAGTATKQATLTEGHEASRWAKLAGIEK